MHTKLKDGTECCTEALDVFGDHCVICGISGHLFTRHGAINHVIAEAGRAAGYTALMEQVVPEHKELWMITAPIDSSSGLVRRMRYKKKTMLGKKTMLALARPLHLYKLCDSS